MKGFTQHQSISTSGTGSRRSRIFSRCGFGAGFTLIETLVAVAIISIAISAPLYEASQGLQTADRTKNQLTASFLAQEAIEYARMLRDNAYLAAYGGGGDISTAAWNTFSSAVSACAAPNTCVLDTYPGASPALAACGGNCSGQYLYLVNSTGQYTQQSTVPGSVLTPYLRTFQVSGLSATDATIISTVSWVFNGTPYTVSVTDHLTPWQ